MGLPFFFHPFCFFGSTGAPTAGSPQKFWGFRLRLFFFLNFRGAWKAGFAPREPVVNGVSWLVATQIFLEFSPLLTWGFMIPILTLAYFSFMGWLKPPPTRVKNKGLCRDSLLKMVHNPWWSLASWEGAIPKL